MNKKEALQVLQEKLATDARWAQRALLAIFKNQTADEQMEGTVNKNNNMGFRCVDSHLLTSFASQLKTRGFLSPKQMVYVHKKMPVYARQLMKFYGDAIVTKLS